MSLLKQLIKKYYHLLMNLIYHSKVLVMIYTTILRKISIDTSIYLLEIWNSEKRGSFRKSGYEFFLYFMKMCDLKPTDKVLDVGCGAGRMAVPFTQYLTSGIYEGFDVSDKGIKWCKEHITPRYSNFQFYRVDIYNKHYNIKGKYTASNFKFPYKTEYFDFIFLKSVFTHMLPKNLENYMSEISRVLKRNGKCLITYFLLNQESLRLGEADLCNMKFRYIFDGYFTSNKKVHEMAIAFSEDYILNLYKKFGLKIIGPIYYGNWCQRKNSLSYQDFIIAIKE